MIQYNPWRILCRAIYLIRGFTDGNYNKKEIIDRIVKKTQCKNITVKEIVQQFLDEITAELAKDNRLEFRDFSVFEVKERAERTAQNPKTLEKIQVPAKRSVKFKMGRLMRLKLNGQR